MTKTEPTPWATAAKAARSAIAAARKSGQLGTLPETLKIQVRSDSFSGGASVDIRLTGADWWAWGPNGKYAAGATLTEPVRKLGVELEVLLRSAIRGTEAGYIWGSITYDGASLASIARDGWRPGED